MSKLLDRLHRGASAMLLVVACGPSSGSPTDTQSTSTGPSATDTGLPVTTSIPTTSGSQTSQATSAASTSSASETGVDSGFLPPPPDLGGPQLCDTYTQQCPPGQKCTVDFIHNSAICVPVPANPAHLDEPCTVLGELGSGLDDCDAGLYCWNYGDKGHGTCSIFCVGVPGDPKCPEGMQCAVTADQYIDLCVRPCNPLLQDCPNDQACIPPDGFEPGVGYPFYCQAPQLDGRHDGALHSPCNYAAQCSSGLVCLHPKPAVECKDSACCEPYCDTDAANSCPGQGQACLPWFPPELAPPGQENVGVCTIPP